MNGKKKFRQAFIKQPAAEAVITSVTQRRTQEPTQRATVNTINQQQILGESHCCFIPRLLHLRNPSCKVSHDINHRPGQATNEKQNQIRALTTAVRRAWTLATTGFCLV